MKLRYGNISYIDGSTQYFLLLVEPTQYEMASVRGGLTEPNSQREHSMHMELKHIYALSHLDENWLVWGLSLSSKPQLLLHFMLVHAYKSNYDLKRLQFFLFI